MIFEVENIKCGGCANSISQKLLTIERVERVAPFRAMILEALARMGYPEKGSVEGLGSVKAKATSYVSCAVGKLGD